MWSMKITPHRHAHWHTARTISIRFHARVTFEGGCKSYKRDGWEKRKCHQWREQN